MDDKVINFDSMNDFNNSLEYNSFNVHCNPASPWYQHNKGLSSDDSSINVHQIHLTKKEKKVIKRIFVALIIISTILSLLLGLERGLEFFGGIFPILLFGGFIPYLFVKDIYLSIKQKRREKKKKHKQLELPL